ncbi:inorganic diphosphatase [Yimella sp. cx-51]|nr:inorganic diphosphatase [Yimella sp. cx-51]
MVDFNEAFGPGDVDGGLINVVVEISKGSTLKVEWDRVNKVMKLDRVEPQVFTKPTSYGFIPQTLDEDGDELDVLVLTEEPLPTGLVMEGRVIGIMKFIDDGEVDDKVVVVPSDDRNTGDGITTMDDVNPQLIKQIEFHFNNYKALKKPGSTRVDHWGDAAEAIEVIHECAERWNNK